jgi:predicted TIM-barrel fold metal-dependent hydrolase
VTEKLDAFCHILPKPYFDRLQEISDERAANLLRRTAPIKHLWDLDTRFELMEGFDDYSQIISLAAPPIEALGDTGLATELATLANDELAELVSAYPDRFAAFIAGLPMNDVDAALAEVDRAINDLGAVGVQFYTHVNGEPLDDERYEPLYARMEEHDKPIWVHPARNSSWPDYPSEGKSKYEVWWLFGWPYDTSAFMARLVFSGLMDRYPGLKVITHHGGGMVPFFSGRVGPGMDSFGARTPDDEAELLEGDMQGRPLDGFKRFYADTAVFGAPHALRCAYDFFGIDHMLFASDMPFDPVQGTFIRDTIADVEALEISQADRARIYEGNARELLGIKVGA